MDNLLTRTGVVTLVAICLLVFVQISDCTELFFQSCPENLHGVEDFNTTAALGKWYELERFGYFSDYGGSCLQFEYSPVLKDGNSLVTNIDHKHLGGWSTWHTKGTSTFKSRSTRADFNLLVQVTSFYSVPLDYSILDTDYGNYAVLWACQNATDSTHNEGLWVLARSPQYSQHIIDMAHSTLRSLGFDPGRLRKSDTSTC